MDLRESLNAIMEIVEKKCNEGDYIEISNKIKEVYNIKTTVEVEETVQYHVRTLEMINRENLELSESGVNIDILMKDVLTTTDRSQMLLKFILKQFIMIVLLIIHNFLSITLMKNGEFL